MRRLATTRTCTAYHEAGHVVLAHVNGLRVLGVSVQKDRDSFGRTCYGPVAPVEASEATDARARRRIEACVLCYLAGTEAEARFAGRRDRRGASFDLAEAAECAGQVVLSKEELEAYLGWLAARVRALVRTYWKLIDGLARALLLRETMNAREVQETLRALSSPRGERRVRAAGLVATAARATRGASRAKRRRRK